MNVNALFQNTHMIYNCLAERYNITNPFFILSPSKRMLTWTNYLTKEKFYSYEEYYDWVSNNLQYSMSLSEVAFFQIFFEEKDGEIFRGSLSFLPRPDLLMTPFRFDLDLLNVKSYYHNSYHVNFGYRSDDFRFTVNKFPFPSEFVKFCLFLNGSEEFNSFNRKKFFKSLGLIREDYSHSFDFEVK
jgi:hypothetical protein